MLSMIYFIESNILYSFQIANQPILDKAGYWRQKPLVAGVPYLFLRVSGLEILRVRVC